MTKGPSPVSFGDCVVEPGTSVTDLLASLYARLTLAAAASARQVKVERLAVAR